MNDRALLHKYLNLAIEKAALHEMPAVIYRVETGGIWLRFERHTRTRINNLAVQPLIVVYPEAKGE